MNIIGVLHRACGMSMILWANGDVDVMPRMQAEHLLASMSLCLFAAECRAEG